MLYLLLLLLLLNTLLRVFGFLLQVSQKSQAMRRVFLFCSFSSLRKKIRLNEKFVKILGTVSTDRPGYFSMISQ